MSTKTKKWIFWAIIIIIIIGIGLYLKFAGFGNTLMAIFIGAVGVCLGWILKWFYDKYIKVSK